MSTPNSAARWFSFYGVIIRLQVESGEALRVLERLELDFKYFSQAVPQTSPSHSLLLSLGPAPEKGPAGGPPLFKTKMCRVYGWGHSRYCDYGQNSATISEFHGHERRIQIFSPSEDLLYEIAYTAILSVVGEGLDQKGFHRIHSLAISIENQGTLLCLPSYGGKSSLGYLLAKDQSYRILSDESPLLREGVIYPFPTHGALHPEVANALGLDINSLAIMKRRCFKAKVLYHYPPASIAEPAPIKNVIFGKFTDGKPQIKLMSKWSAYAYALKYVVIGLGLAQMAEHMLRFDDLLNLSKIALSRLRCSVELVRANSCFLFSYGPNAFENKMAVKDFLDSQSSLSTEVLKNSSSSPNWKREDLLPEAGTPILPNNLELPSTYR